MDTHSSTAHHPLVRGWPRQDLARSHPGARVADPGYAVQTGAAREGSGSGTPSVGCANIVLRLLCGRDAASGPSGSGIDLDTLGADLHRLWQSFGAHGRRAARIDVSCVESCADSREAREQDARRLIELEGAAHQGGALANALRATLVRLDPGEYLLLLAAPAAASAASLTQLIAELSRQYPLVPA